MEIITKEDARTFAENILRQGNALFKTEVKLDRIEWFSDCRAGGFAIRKADIYYIKLSEGLFNRSQKDLKDVIIHEIAHLIVFSTNLQGRSKDRGHGKWWKHVCRTLGGNGQRCIDYSLGGAVRRTKRFHYILPSGYEMLVTLGQHKKLQSGLIFYHGNPKEYFNAKYFTGKISYTT